MREFMPTAEWLDFWYTANEQLWGTLTPEQRTWLYCHDKAEQRAQYESWVIDLSQVRATAVEGHAEMTSVVLLYAVPVG